MRLISFVQVLLLLAIVAYLILFILENPALVRLPLPFGRGELSLSVGVTVTLFALVGAAYMALLLLPPVVQERLRRRQERRERRAVEQQLTATLQARLGAIPTATLPEPSASLRGPSV
ncbi:lipopolysaccharide assembly protein LapA domain-containing protein [Deinococcus arenicola]|uniref:Lipopolysaccharide assembly protein LapA domain-containing protein n=1 Tax=Deinococcus arenicola TaxID=2994950 RepID=A0ABU4DQT7_9DEIO|nr:lipopolysaccharide assembly protein LapA domain-containing protein [Deinococcus sp. ZS9-10]MDV6374332.1 lipopolysaccharide assembly protein LapA domain-containing protein [Deinococcus sp. ZS9-10]